MQMHATHTHIHIDMRTHTPTHTHTHVNLSLSLYIYIYIYTCSYVYTCASTHAHRHGPGPTLSPLSARAGPPCHLERPRAGPGLCRDTPQSQTPLMIHNVRYMFWHIPCIVYYMLDLTHHVLHNVCYIVYVIYIYIYIYIHTYAVHHVFCTTVRNTHSCWLGEGPMRAQYT